MKIFIRSQVDKQSLIGDIKTEYSSSVKQAATDSDDFLISGTNKREFQLLPYNGFSIDIIENLPVGAKLKYLHVDIIDVNDVDNPGAVNHKFNLTINAFDLKQLSRFELCNIDDSLDLTSIIIDQVTIPEDYAANLIIYVAYYIPAIGTTTTTTAAPTTTTTTTTTP